MPNDLNTKRMILAPTTDGPVNTASCSIGVASFSAQGLTRRLVRFRRDLLELLRLSPRNAQGPPLTGTQMLGQKYELADMLGVVRNLPIDRLQHGMRFAADGDGAHHVLRLQSVDRSHHARPAVFPPFHYVGPHGWGSNFKLAVPEAVRFLAIAGQEVGEARPHVAGKVLNEDCNRVGLRIQQNEELLIF